MAGGKSDSAVLSDRALNRATLARQMLLERQDVTVSEALTRLVGVQGQTPNAPYFGLWSRLRHFAIEDLQDLLSSHGAVRASFLRMTLHVTTAEDFLAIRPLMQRQAERALTGGRKPEFEGLDIVAVQKAGQRLMAKEPLAGTEIGRRLQAKFPAFGAEPLGRVVRLLEPLAHVPPAGFWNSGKAPVLAGGEAWTGGKAKPAAVADLIRRYLLAFGPASRADFTVWSGLTAAQAFAALRPELVSFRGENGRELFDLPEAPRPGDGVVAPARLVAPYDNLILGYAERRRIVAPEHFPQIASNNGKFRPTFTVDGFVAGIWALSEGKGAARVTLSPFAPLKARDKAALRREAEQLLATFCAGQGHEVVFELRGEST